MDRYNNRTYRIDGIEWGKNPLNKFQLRSGEMTSYVDYYKTSYNRDMIHDLHQVLPIATLGGLSLCLRYSCSRSFYTDRGVGAPKIS